MNPKRLILLTAVTLLVIINILFHWNISLYYGSEKIEDNEKKIKILERASRIYPFNDLVFYELGKAYFDLGINSLNNKALSEASLRKSIESFTRSIKINSASFFSHFYLAQSLLYMSYLSSSSDINSFDEYKKAALLAGHNSQVFYEVGKIFFSKWPEFSEKERNFTLEVLRKIASGKEREKLLTLMEIWDLDVRDYSVMEEILPEDIEVYRFYAQFLGEKSLSMEIRQNILAKAEFMEFERAKSQYRSGENAFLYFRWNESIKHFKSCLDTLKRIDFYQNLTHQKLIDISEYYNLNKSVRLNLAKCLIEEGKELKEAEEYLRMYLGVEDKVAAIGELESYLRDKGLIEDKLEENFNDLNRLAFQVFLYFKQNRYRQIMKAGQVLRESFVVVPEMKKDSYVEILQLVGDSYQKADYIYEALEFYQKALEIEPDNLTTLLKKRQSFERLNEEQKIQEIDKIIEKLLTPGEMKFEDYMIDKRQKSSHTLTLDGREIILNLYFKVEKGIEPLISVFFNGRIVWEGYLKDKEGRIEEGERRVNKDEINKVISLSLKSEVGENALVVIPLNEPVSLTEIRFNFEK